MKYPQLVSMPSEISNWLEEQLEARGIDAVVYTRYVLSLLRDPPDQERQFTEPHKELRRSVGGRKRFRQSSERWENVHTDTEQRSAAVECLMSASDQNCGIESLVDELCEKLKEIKSDSSASAESSTQNKNINFQNISPHDLAKRYYAAFPPLSRSCSTRSPNSIVNLIPKWFASPKKKTTRRHIRSSSCEEKLHHKLDSESMKARPSGKRFSYFCHGKSDLGYSRSMAKSVERSESMTDWDLYTFTNNSKNKTKVTNSQQYRVAQQEDKENFEQSVTESGNDNVWNKDQNANLYEDLPFDILELLDSPGPQDYTVEMMNLANMKDVGNRNFIQCGTNITTSIWSIDAVMDDATMFDNTYNTAIDADHTGTLLGFKFNSLSMGSKIPENIWSKSDVNIIAENETNLLFENYGKSSLLSIGNKTCIGYNSFDTPWSTSTGLAKLEKWSEAESFDEPNFSNLVRSFMKLNHKKDESSFTEVVPKNARDALNFFSTSKLVHNVNAFKKLSTDETEENLLTSDKSHFRPIKATNEVAENRPQKQYADGTTFVISANLDCPNYKRSDSGSLYIDSEKGPPKKLYEYKQKVESSKTDFMLKFLVCQNDKACQTVDSDLEQSEMDSAQEVPCKKLVMSEPEDFYFPGDKDLVIDSAQLCTCNSSLHLEKKATNMDFVACNDLEDCPTHVVRSDSMMTEIIWNSKLKQCDKCNSSSSWNNKWLKAGTSENVWQLDKKSLRSIWNGGEICSACVTLNRGCPPSSLQQSRLREDISQDGEQLLSDLSSLQMSYMEQLPTAEVSYDISELLACTKERKRRHSPTLGTDKNAVPVHRGSWSIAPHVKQKDHFIHMTTIPLLHSVTL